MKPTIYTHADAGKYLFIPSNISQYILITCWFLDHPIQVYQDFLGLTSLTGQHGRGVPSSPVASRQVPAPRRRQWTRPRSLAARPWTAGPAWSSIPAGTRCIALGIDYHRFMEWISQNIGRLTKCLIHIRSQVTPFNSIHWTRVCPQKNEIKYPKMCV